MDHGLPWLDRFPDRQAVLDQFFGMGAVAIGMSPAGDLDIAVMLAAMGKVRDARRVLERYVERPLSRGHATYLAEYLPSIGHGDLVRRLTLRDQSVERG